GLDPQPWEERLRALAPRRDIRLWPQRVGDPADIAYACAWHAPRGLFARLPRLQAIFSLGAGVDHVLTDPDLPDVPVVRIVDPDLTMRMTEYAVLHVLMQHPGSPDAARRSTTEFVYKGQPALLFRAFILYCLRRATTGADNMRTIPRRYPRWPAPLPRSRSPT